MADPIRIENVHDYLIPEGWPMNRRLRDLLATQGTDVVTDARFPSTFAIAHLELVDRVARIEDALRKAGTIGG